MCNDKSKDVAVSYYQLRNAVSWVSVGSFDADTVNQIEIWKALAKYVESWATPAKFNQDVDNWVLDSYDSRDELIESVPMQNFPLPAVSYNQFRFLTRNLNFDSNVAVSAWLKV